MDATVPAMSPGEFQRGCGEASHNVIQVKEGRIGRLKKMSVCPNLHPN